MNSLRGKTSKRSLEDIAANLIDWHVMNGRDYPWRATNDPFDILMAEIMLQRTKADQVRGVYDLFIKRFPNARELSKARISDLRGYFRKLGLLWRARLVKNLGHELVEKWQGNVPRTRIELIALPSVGEYVADAVLSFAFHKDVVVVDSNVCRVIGRLFGIEAKNEARRDRRFREKAEKILPKGKSREFNLALLDFAASICVPKEPKCFMCPIKTNCAYYSESTKKAEKPFTTRLTNSQRASNA